MYRNSINDVINNFSGAIREVADPLFSKYCSYKNNPYFNDQSVLNQAEWFDIECTRARNSYLEALRVFNRVKSNKSREYFCKLKKRL